MGKIQFVPAQSLPLDKLATSSANVRRVRTGVSITELAEDIGRRGLLQSLNVRAVLDETGVATGRYAVVAGGRRLAALQLLVKAKRLAKNALVPCIVGAESGVASGEQKPHHARQDGMASAGAAEEDSLAENTMREALHPLDQFRAFQALRETHGMGEEAIAARCFVTPAVVRQRLRLAAVSPKLLDLYAEDGVTLDQLMAFTVTADHARQEAVWEALSRGHGREAYAIRRMLTAGAVRGSDKRAGFVGLEAYEAAGGTLERDLFEVDGGGYLRDVALLDQLVDEKLAREANTLRQEGWLWVEALRDLPYGHVFGLRRLRAETVPLSDEAQAEHDRLVVEQEALETQYATSEDMPEAADQRLSEIETRLTELENRRQAFDADEVVRAGAFVSIGTGGTLQVERGFVRPEDEPREPEPEAVPDIAVAEMADDEIVVPALATGSMPTAATAEAETSLPPEDEDHDGGRISDRLMTELTAHRTLALRAALSADPDTASLVVLHALALWTFHGTDLDTCVEIDGRSATLDAHASGLGDMAASRTLVDRFKLWQAQLPRRPQDLWAALVALDPDSRAALLALCVGRSVNALVQSWDRRPRAVAHADQLAGHLGLDMAADGAWTPTVERYLGRVSKARILDAVRDASGERAAQGIAHLRKAEMAEAAERLLAGTGWLPGPLRTAGRHGLGFVTREAGREDDRGAVQSEDALGDGHHADSSDDAGPETAVALLPQVHAGQGPNLPVAGPAMAAE